MVTLTNASAINFKFGEPYDGGDFSGGQSSVATGHWRDERKQKARRKKMTKE